MKSSEKNDNSSADTANAVNSHPEGDVCPKCGRLTASRFKKNYSLIDAIGLIILFLFLFGIVSTGIFGRFTFALLIALLIGLVVGLQKLVNFQRIRVLSCPHCGYEETLNEFETNVK